MLMSGALLLLSVLNGCFAQTGADDKAALLAFKAAGDPPGNDYSLYRTWGSGDPCGEGWSVNGGAGAHWVGVTCCSGLDGCCVNCGTGGASSICCITGPTTPSWTDMLERDPAMRESCPAPGADCCAEAGARPCRPPHCPSPSCLAGDTNAGRVTSLMVGLADRDRSGGTLEDLTSLTALRILDTGVAGDLSALSGMLSMSILNLREPDYRSRPGATTVTGDLASLSDLVSMTSLTIRWATITGEITSLAGMVLMVALDLTGCTNVSGDIAALGNMVSLTTLHLLDTNVHGDIAAFGSMSALGSLQLAGTSAHGDADQLRAAIPKLASWGISDQSGRAFTSCTYLPCGTHDCVTGALGGGRYNPWPRNLAVCGVAACNADDVVRIGRASVDDQDAIFAAAVLRPDAPYDADDACQCCMQLHVKDGTIDRTAPVQDVAAALVDTCGPASIAPAPDIPSSCATFPEFTVFSGLVTDACCTQVLATSSHMQCFRAEFGSKARYLAVS